MSDIGSDNGWLEAAIAWEVCASLHRQYCKGKDALFTTRQSDFVKHAEDARARAPHGQASSQPECLTCNDHGAVGNILTAEPCPDCTRKAEPAVEQDAAYREAKHLAEALFKKHYARDKCYSSGAVEWGLCDSTAGIISQIDNMVCQLVRPAEVPLLTDEEVGMLAVFDGLHHVEVPLLAEFVRHIETAVRQKAGL